MNLIIQVMSRKTFIGILAFLLLSLSSFNKEINLDSILKTLMTLESNNNPNARGDNGKSLGVLQIRFICIQDVNRIYKTTFKHEDAFSIEKSKRIFHLYIRHGIRLFIRKYKSSPTEEDIVRMWNGGIYDGYREPETEKYYYKYLKIKT